MFPSKRRIVRGLTILFLLVLIAGGVGATGAWLWADYHFKAGQDALEHHRLAVAREHFRLCLLIWPNDGRTHFLAGRAARRAGDLKEAERHLTEARRLLGRALDVGDEMALIGVQVGGVDFTEKHFQTLVNEQHPDSALFLEAFVRGYLRVHRLIDADACFQRWANLQQDNPYLYLLRGEARERIPNLVDAAADYNKVLELDPSFDEAHLRVARVLLGLHDGNEALPHLLHLRSVRPNDIQVLVLLGRCYVELARPEDARPVLAEAMALDPKDTSVLYASAQLAMQEGNTEQAEAILRQAIAIDPNDRELNFLFAQCLTQRGKVGEAEQQTTKFKRIDADMQTLHFLTTKKMGESPHDPDVQSQVGVILLRLGEERMGVEWLKRALAINPEHAASRKALDDYQKRPTKR
jgi:tetratricopeptide (TPR) repeat protein